MSDDAGLWLIFVLIGLATTLPRASFIVLGERASLPDVVQRALRYAPAAALTAIVVPDLLPWKAGLGPVFDYKLVAGVLVIALFENSMARLRFCATSRVTWAGFGFAFLAFVSLLAA